MKMTIIFLIIFAIRDYAGKMTRNRSNDWTVLET